jgi:SAM-dependent methyltransferase
VDDPRYGYRPLPAGASSAAGRAYWDDAAPAYRAEHGGFLGSGVPGGRFVWGPEGLDEADAGLLGDVAGLDVLDLGCGQAQTTRWLAGRGARVVGLDVSLGMLRHAGEDAPPLVQGDAARLPFAGAAFDLVCSAYGGVPFVADGAALVAGVARVLRPGGRFVFSVTHPVRWAFPDDPGEAGLTATRSYFDRTPYVETAEDGSVTYAEHHRTLGDRVRDLAAAGFVLLDVVEPQWPEDHDQVWGGWSPLRGRLLPGTAVFVARLR